MHPLFRALDAAVNVASRFGLRPAELDVHQILAAADRRRTTAPLEAAAAERLRIFIDSVNREARLSGLMRALLKHELVRRTATYLRIRDYVASRPEIAGTAIERPIFIVGLPRTGSTLLHRLLAEDPATRWPALWEMDQPTPPPGMPEKGRDPRPAAFARKWRLIKILSAGSRHIHDLAASGPEECSLLLANSLWLPLGAQRFYIPSFHTWFHGTDLTEAYRLHRTQLQLLQHQRPGAPWVLKCPLHMHGLRWLLSVYPDARIVRTHRAARDVVASSASLACAGYLGKSDPVAIAGWVYRRMLEYLRAARDARDQAPPSARFLDVHYHDLVADPMLTVSQLYATLQIELSPLAKARMNSYILRHPQHEHGVHRYDLREFGLDGNQIDRDFAALL